MRRRGQGRGRQQPRAAAAALSLINDAHHLLRENDWSDCGTTAEQSRAEHNTTQNRLLGKKILLLPLRERQLTGVKVRRRRRRRHRRRRRLRLAAEEGGRKQGERTNERTNELRARKAESFCAFFAGSIRSLGGRGRLDRERERGRGGTKDGGGAQKVAPHFHFLPRRPPPTIDFESALFALGEAPLRSEHYACGIDIQGLLFHPIISFPDGMEAFAVIVG